MCSTNDDECFYEVDVVANVSLILVDQRRRFVDTTYSNGELLGEIIICPENRAYWHHALICRGLICRVVVSSYAPYTSPG
jgi:hypothetical protein